MENNQTIPMPIAPLSSELLSEETVAELNEYLDWLEEAVGEQELPEDFTF